MERLTFLLRDKGGQLSSSHRPCGWEVMTDDIALRISYANPRRTSQTSHDCIAVIVARGVCPPFSLFLYSLPFLSRFPLTPRQVPVISESRDPVEPDQTIPPEYAHSRRYRLRRWRLLEFP
jgi:hypothetical protein